MYLFVALIISLQIVDGLKSQCQIHKWKWPEDFKTYITGANTTEYQDVRCWPLTHKTLLHPGRMLCWKRQPTDFFPLKITWEPEMFTKMGMVCIAMKEPSDWFYTTRYLCMPKYLQNKFKFNWQYKASNITSSNSPCVAFGSTSGGFWHDNRLCSENRGVITQTVCTECRKTLSVS